MDVRVLESPAAVAKVTAARIARRLRAGVRVRGTATVAFSGGSTPKLMLVELVTLDVPWDRIDVFQVDERVAPDGDPDRNAGELDVLPLSRRRVHLMGVTTADLPAACRRYARSLPPRLDVVHLGVGDDGHTASWPPGDAVIDTTDPVVTCGPFNGRVRMTLTPPVVNHARWRVVQLVGGSKADAVRRWLTGDSSLPISLVRRTDTLVVLDAAAAAAVDIGRNPSVSSRPRHRLSSRA